MHVESKAHGQVSGTRNLTGPPPVPAVATRPVTFKAEMKLLPGVFLPLRSMLIPTSTMPILISPVGTVEEAATVTTKKVALVAPSLLHHLHLEFALNRYRPSALWVPPGFVEKQPSIKPTHTFGRDPWPYKAEVDFLVVDGAPIRNEVLFFHRASRTVYTADLFFNILNPRGALTPINFRMMGIHKRFAMSRVWRFWVKDRPAFKRSMERLLAWPFDRLVVAHGDVVESGAHDLVVEALAERGFLPDGFDR